jgi:tripartite-type tricarboxylate transporter receptor subunit TctC
MDRRFFLKGAATLGMAAAAAPLRAQQVKYPSRPIRFVVPFAAGGGGDVVARMLAQRLSERIGNPVIVENRTGAGGNIGSDYVLKSPPDGYTLLNMSSTYPIQAAVSPLPFDPIADMQPIIMVSRDPVVLVVNPASTLRTARDLLEAAKRNPDKLTHGSAGVGSIAHLGMEELAFLMGIRLVHVPYKGSSQAFNDLLGNSVDLMLTSATFGAPFIKSGRVRALGIAGRNRMPTLPDVPTFEEQGFPGYDVVDWKAVAGPRGMPPDVVAFLNTELNAVLKHKSVAEKFHAEGTTPVGGSPEDMMQTVRSDIERWKNVAEKAKVKIE